MIAGKNMGVTSSEEPSGRKSKAAGNLRTQEHTTRYRTPNPKTQRTLRKRRITTENAELKDPGLAEAQVETKAAQT